LDLTVPRVIDYPVVLATLQSAGLNCVYPNSGAFGLPPGCTPHVVGWAHADDPTIRPHARAALRIVPDGSLPALLNHTWLDDLAGPLWLMPASHWAYELQFGSADWLPPLLSQHGLDPESLRPRTDGSAIEFAATESDSLLAMVQQLFTHLIASDFTVTFPGRPVVALLHHHRQIWWQTSDLAIWKSLDSLT
jgi:hypothetical protein